jgi:hypothetical protein
LLNIGYVRNRSMAGYWICQKQMHGWILDMMQYHSIHLTSTYPISNHRPTSDICNVQESTSLSHIQYSAMHLSDINIQSFIYRWHTQYLPINMYLRYPTPFTCSGCLLVWMFTSSGCLLVWMFTSSGCTF